MSPVAPVSVVGIGQGGCLELSARAINAISRAQVLVGGRRQLAFFPEFEGEVIVLEKGILATIERVKELAEDRNICVLASGDPLFFGIGKLLAKKIGGEHVEVLTAPSSVQLAFAQLKLNWDDACLLSVHGRSLRGLASKMAGQHKVAILTDPEHSPARIATHLMEYGQQGWQAYVCQDLGGPEQRVQAFTSLSELATHQDSDVLNVLVLLRESGSLKEAQFLVPSLNLPLPKRCPKKASSPSAKCE